MAQVIGFLLAGGFAFFAVDSFAEGAYGVTTVFTIALLAILFELMSKSES